MRILKINKDREQNESYLNNVDILKSKDCSGSAVANPNIGGVNSSSRIESSPLINDFLDFNDEVKNKIKKRLVRHTDLSQMACDKRANYHKACSCEGVEQELRKNCNIPYNQELLVKPVYRETKLYDCSICGSKVEFLINGICESCRYENQETKRSYKNDELIEDFYKKQKTDYLDKYNYEHILSVKRLEDCNKRILVYRDLNSNSKIENKDYEIPYLCHN
ncbi:unnamed protein product, partial [marine sediment metagenome]